MTGFCRERDNFNNFDKGHHVVYEDDDNELIESILVSRVGMHPVQVQQLLVVVFISY